MALLLIGIAIRELVGVYKAHKHQQFINSIKDDPQKMRDAEKAGQISQQEREALRRDESEERMNKTMDQYFALSPSDRAAWMRNLIKEQEARREHWQQMRAAGGGPTSRPWGNGGNNPNAQNQANNAASRTARYESRNPTRMSQFQQFHADMAAAYKSMGMEPPKRGRGR
ncbi:MAG TPA: hypothetical protein VHY37_14080 [Tepidisphaeraceae bacterium]|nr:hypothetical protein [Tepidisphaeraceae bacterium]